MAEIDVTKELHVCMGLNSCKNQSYSGNNSCAGQGDCATVTHACHVLNECKGQGGCGLFGTTKEFCHPGENDCRYQGSCGSPILSSRFIVQGPNKGTSVWQLARKRFEEKRTANNLPYGPQPASQPYGPTNDYVRTVRADPTGSYSSCGQSGDRYCSYAIDKTARAEEAQIRHNTFVKDSAAEMPKTLSNCPADGE